MISAGQALNYLQEGNHRFVSNINSLDAPTSRNQRAEMITDQRPFAVVLGCSDSRVPVELVFDQGFGDLFVIRVAGNVVAPSQIGSVEFAAERFGTRLVVVLGHTRCGAIEATLEHLQSSKHDLSPNLLSIVNRIRPSVEGLLSTELVHDREALAREAVRANVRVCANHLRHESKLLEDLIDRGDLLVVGTEYSLESGIVNFFDGLPESSVQQ